MTADRTPAESPAFEAARAAYRSALAAREDDDRIARAVERWRAAVAPHGGDPGVAGGTESAGDAGGGRPGADASGDDAVPLADALFYDHLVARLTEAFCRDAGVALTNPTAMAGTGRDPVGFEAVHRAVAERSPGLDDLPTDELLADAAADGTAFLRERYESAVAPEARRALGEYYTPRGVTELAVESLDFDAADWRDGTFLDPGCGAGAFLAACVRRKREALADAGVPDAEAVRRVAGSVYGVDVNPLAVRSAKLAYLLSLAPLLRSADVREVELPVFCTDALGLTREDDLTFRGAPFDVEADALVGNPPWMTWGDLPESVRGAWRERSDELDLLPHRGTASRLGHANDDVSVAFALTCAHRHLRDGGRAAFVLKRDLTKGPAGRGLRRLRAGDRRLALRRVHDFGGLRPFAGVNAGTAVYALDADAEPSFPVPVTAWRAREGRRPDFSSVAAMRESLRAEETAFLPVDPDDGASPWVRRDAERRALGENAHEIRHGVKDDAKEVFSVDRDGLDAVDAELIYPYLRSRHVVKYGLFGYDLHLVPLRKANEDNEAFLRETYPRTYDYLRSRRDRLDARASSWLSEGGTFYDVFGLGPYTWADYKVVWCRLGFKPHFAVVSTVDDPDLGEKTVVPGDHCMFVATDDRRTAHYLCALLNSAPYQRTLRDVAGEGKSSLSKSTVSRLALPDRPEGEAAERLADLSVEAHGVVPEYTDRSKRAYNALSIDELDAVQAEIDETVERLLTDRAGR